MKSVKDHAYEIFVESLGTIGITDQKNFRRRVKDILMEKFQLSDSAATTHYQTAKKLAEKNGLVEGLGRKKSVPEVFEHQPNNPTLVHKGLKSDRKHQDDADFDDCYSAIRVIGGVIQKSYSFRYYYEAEDYAEEYGGENNNWIIVKGCPDPDDELNRALTKEFDDGGCRLID